MPAAPDERLADLSIALERLRTAQARLRECEDVPALLSRGAELARCECGFDRALIVAVEGRSLIAADMDALPDVDSDRLRRRLAREPLALPEGCLELALLRAVDEDDVLDRDRPSVLARRLGLVHHAMGVLVLDGVATALLVVDRDAGEVDGLDVALVASFAVVLSAALEQAAQRLRLEQVAMELRHLTAFTQALMRETLEVPLTLPRRRAGGMAFPLVEATAETATGAWESLLTAQELRVARLLARGRSNREIADELVLSVETVKSHVQRVLRKLGVTSRSQATARMLGTDSGV